MPHPCCVPGCRGNYKTGPKVRVYGFPKDVTLAAKWLHAIKRDNFTITSHSRVCELHFKESDFQRTSSSFDEKNGRTITVQLQVPKLIPGSVPSKLPNLPSYLSATPTISRESPQSRRQRLEEHALRTALEVSASEKVESDSRLTFSSIGDLHSKMNLIDTQIWTVLYKNDKINIMKIVADPAPIIQFSVVVNSELMVSAFLKDTELSNIGKYTIPLKVTHINVLNDILNHLRNQCELPLNGNNLRNTINSICSILKTLRKKCESYENHLKFIEEQLLLLGLDKHALRYSSDITVFASLFFSMAPHAYNFVRESGSIILPHPSTIRRICLQFNVNPEAENLGSNFLSYVRQKFSFLNEIDKTVVLLLDEIHLKQYLDFKGGSICGLSFNSQNMATTAHVFMIKSLLSKYKDVVHLLPAKTMSADILFVVLKKIVIGLEEIGFSVICVVTDNNSINRKCMSLFVSPPKIQIVYPHPADKSRPLFFLVDAVHLLKCIRNNWLNQKNIGKCMYYPQFENISIPLFKTASLSTLKELHKVEANSLLKYGYNLSYKALNPSNLERQNVKLVLKIFNDFVAKGLLEIGKKHKLLHFQDTSDFITIILTWWQIVNVKSPYKGVRLNNKYQTPLTCSESDEKFMFLHIFIDWLDKWECMGCTTGMLSKETHTALKLSAYSLLEIASYCTSELKLNYILPGKFQTDDLESRFGLYRQLAGSQYNISVRQLFECETKLRVQSLLKLPTMSSGEIQISDLDFKDNFEQMNLKSVCNLKFNITVLPSDISDCNDYLPVIAYIAGYSVFSVLKSLKCDFCKQLLLLDKKIELDAKFNFLIKLDRGSLCCPTEGVINAVLYNYIVMKKLCCEFEKEFMEMPNQRNVVTLITSTVLARAELFYNNYNSCDVGHLIEKTLEMIIWASTNIFLNNYCKMKNDILLQDLAKKSFNDKKRKLSTLTK